MVAKEKKNVPIKQEEVCVKEKNEASSKGRCEEVDDGSVL